MRATIIVATIALGLTSPALAQAGGKDDPAVIAARKAECLALPFHTWVEPYKAGDISPRTGKPYKVSSNGRCRANQKAVTAAAKAGTLKQQ